MAKRMTVRVLQFQPEQTKLLEAAYELVCKTFERERKLNPAERMQLARAIFTAAEAGPINLDKLATQAILAAIAPSARRPV